MNAEQKILHAAKKVFHEKGFYGMRMQEVADAAGINKALMHYYFKSKEKLFQAVFTNALFELFPSMMGVLNADKPLFEKIEEFTHTYISALQKNPELPGFVIHEITLHPERLVNLLQGLNVQPGFFMKQVAAEVKKGNIVAIAPGHLLANMLSLCVFPFVAKPILKMVGQMTDKQYKIFIEERKTVVSSFIINGLKK